MSLWCLVDSWVKSICQEALWSLLIALDCALQDSKVGAGSSWKCSDWTYYWVNTSADTLDQNVLASPDLLYFPPFNEWQNYISALQLCLKPNVSLATVTLWLLPELQIQRSCATAEMSLPQQVALVFWCRGQKCSIMMVAALYVFWNG